MYRACVKVNQLFELSMVFSPKHLIYIPNHVSQLLDINSFYLISFDCLRDRLSHCACRERAAPPKDLVILKIRPKINS